MLIKASHQPYHSILSYPINSPIIRWINDHYFPVKLKFKILGLGGEDYKDPSSVTVESLLLEAQVRSEAK